MSDDVREMNYKVLYKESGEQIAQLRQEMKLGEEKHKEMFENIQMVRAFVLA